MTALGEQGKWEAILPWMNGANKTNFVFDENSSFCKQKSSQSIQRKIAPLSVVVFLLFLLPASPTSSPPPPPLPSPLPIPPCLFVAFLFLLCTTQGMPHKKGRRKKKRTNRKTNKTRRQSSNYCFCLPGDDVRLAAPLPPSCSCGCGCGCGCDGCCCCCCCCKGTLVPVPCEWTGTLGEGSPWGGCPCMGMV